MATQGYDLLTSSQEVNQHPSASININRQYLTVLFGWRRTLVQETADLHGPVPAPFLAGQVLVVPLQDEALVTEVLDDSALGQAAAGGWVAGVAPVLWFQRRKTH